jgi:hypothetical protein
VNSEISFIAGKGNQVTNHKLQIVIFRSEYADVSPTCSASHTDAGHSAEKFPRTYHVVALIALNVVAAGY